MTVTITGTLIRATDGTPHKGRGFIEPTVPVLLDTAGKKVRLGGHKFTLDATGSFSVDVPATDDPTLSPTGFTYKLTLRLDGGETFDPLTFLAPASLGTVDITALTVAATTTPITASQYLDLDTRKVNKGALVFNVKDYGARGDAVLDTAGNYVSGTTDTAAITAALTAAGTSRGIVYFPPGTYYCATAVTYTGPVHIEGADATVYGAAAITFDFAGNALADGATCTIRGVRTVSATRAACLANGFQWRLAGFNRVTVAECEVRNANEFPLYISGCRNVRVANNRFLSCNASTGDADSLTRYIQLVTCTNATVVDNYFTSAITYVDGVTFAGVSVMMDNSTNVYIGRNRISDAGGIEAYTGCSNVTVEGNAIDACHRYAVKLEESSNVKVLNNTITNSKAAAQRFVIGILPYARMELGTASGVFQRRDFAVEGNLIDNCPQPYLILVQGRAVSAVTGRFPAATQPDVLAYGVSIRRNKVRNSACTIPVHLAYVNDVTMHDNDVIGCTLATTSAGHLAIYGLGDRADIVNNRVHLTNTSGTTTIGIHMAAASGYTGAAAWAHVERNTIVNTSGTPLSTYGIDFGGVSRVRIRQNRILNFNQHIFARSGGNLLINDNFTFTLAQCVITTASFTTVTSDLV